MAELVVIGRYAAEVARAIDGEAWVLDEGEGTPAITARHAGRELNPQELRAAAGAAAVVGLVGNPVSPLTPRYSLRDLAMELGAPVVVTDTIPLRTGAPDNIRVLSCADLLTDSIRRIFTDDSVSEVFGGENQLF